MLNWRRKGDELERREAGPGGLSGYGLRGTARDCRTPRLVSATRGLQVPELSLVDILPRLAVARSGKDWKGVVRVDRGGSRHLLTGPDYTQPTPPSGRLLRVLDRYLSDKLGGLNGSTQHQLEVQLRQPGTLKSFATVKSNKNTTLYRFTE